MDNILKNILAGVCTVLSFLFGDMEGLMIALVALIILDYISGVIAAAVENRLSSEVGAKGRAKKIFMLLMILFTKQIMMINIILVLRKFIILMIRQQI